MYKWQIKKAIKNGDLEKLKKEAIKRGYVDGTIIRYFEDSNYERIGDGEYDIKDGMLIKYDIDKYFDILWDEKDGWTKIIKRNE